MHKTIKTKIILFPNDIPWYTAKCNACSEDLFFCECLMILTSLWTRQPSVGYCVGAWVMIHKSFIRLECTVCSSAQKPVSDHTKLEITTSTLLFEIHGGLRVPIAAPFHFHPPLTTGARFRCQQVSQWVSSLPPKILSNLKQHTLFEMHSFLTKKDSAFLLRCFSLHVHCL